MPKEYLGDLQYFTSHADVRGEFFGIAAHAALADRGVLFDIGAHAGTISLLFCAAAPGNRAYAFEPSPLLLGRLDASARLNGFGDRLSIQPIAIGERNGSLSVLMDPVGGFVQSQRFAHSMWGEPERREVPMETLEAAAERLGVHPTHVKVDIEGYEHEVVSGSRDYLRRRKPTLFFELHLNYLEERGLDPGAVVGMLSDAGYRFESYGGRARTAAELADCPLASVRFVARAR
jgi:FkbM family methyltransferase